MYILTQPLSPQKPRKTKGTHYTHFNSAKCASCTKVTLLCQRALNYTSIWHHSMRDATLKPLDIYSSKTGLVGIVVETEKESDFYEWQRQLVVK